ncbi:MAG: hypothetical protein ACI8ZM_003722 [Crocinitomix sp.]|jgi:hypothetical protein
MKSTYTLIEEEKLDPAIVALINKAPSSDIISISDKYKIDTQVIKCEDLVFQDGGQLIFTNLNFDAVYIRAKTLKVNTPAKKVFIKRGESSLVQLAGVPGRRGKKGSNGSHSGDDGNKGGTGKIGGTGKEGTEIPDLYIIVDKVEADFKSPTKVNFIVDFSGINGGQGGKGGPGGNGGKARKGKSAKNGPMATCKRGPGNGGDGGQAGKGGKGGTGGNGGDGGNVFLVGAKDAIEKKLSYANIKNDGGLPGNGGAEGKSGGRGKGGKIGSAASCCSSSGRKSGKTGKRNVSGKKGLNGKIKGSRGNIYKLILSKANLPKI